MGIVYGCIGAALAIILSAIGSCIGVGKAGQMAGGLLSKDPSKFTSMLILQLLPATQGLYGFIVAFMAISQMGLLGGSDFVFTNAHGLAMLAVCLPIGIIGLFSAVFQGRVVMAGMEMCFKQDKQMGKALLMAVLVEIFAIFAFVISLMAVLGISGMPVAATPAPLPEITEAFKALGI
ncbi:MAG: V-type ATP synthase subunit K [Clostridiales bacterium]|nr:V-type ATP synthase subunit K [Clostridiales bacterium]